jgi:hypothetical protein
MPFKKPLPGDRSPLTLVAGRDTKTISLFSRPEEIEHDHSALRTSSNKDTAWREIPATVFAPVAKAFGDIAVRGEAGFLHMLFAVTSWVMAEALAGCLAYAEAMYAVELGGPIDGRDPAGNPPRDREDRDQLPNRPSRLRMLDDRTLKSVGLSRCDIESFTSRGDRCE